MQLLLSEILSEKSVLMPIFFLDLIEAVWKAGVSQVSMNNAKSPHLGQLQCFHTKSLTLETARSFLVMETAAQATAVDTMQITHQVFAAN